MYFFKKMKGAILLFLFFTISSCDAQIKNAKTEEVTIYGNCGMCEKKIETAGNVKNISKVEWDKDNKLAKITFNSNKTSVEEILKRIAAVGYDSDKFRASDEVYNNLHECCQYERPIKPEEE